MAALTTLKVVPISRAVRGCGLEFDQGSRGDGRQAMVGTSSFKGVSIRNEERSRNGVVMGRGGVARAAVATAEVTAAALADKREILKKEVESRTFTLSEVANVTPEDWHTATVVKVEDVADGIRCITLSAECSREFIALNKAYRKPGQFVQVKVGGKSTRVLASSPPFSDAVNSPVLYKLRGDIPAGTTKLPAFSLSAKANVDLHVTELDSAALFNVSEGSEVELGPWEQTGLDLRPVMFITRFPTMLLFAQGKGIAVARAILEAKDGDAGSLNLGLREDIRLYYEAPKPSLLAYKDYFSKWEERKSVKVRTVVKSSVGEDWDGYEGNFAYLWDEDDVEYDPQTTGVIIAVDSSKRKEMKRLLEEAEIPESQTIFWNT